MSERLSLQDLIDLLAKKKDIPKKEAETFLREFIALVSETIENNESVKIKDFGTFKLIKVNARKSVDVNTGETIEIPAHYKLGFAPDRILKDSINRPLAHFESVLLEDGVSFDNIKEEKISENEEDEDIEQIPEEELDPQHHIIEEEPLADSESDKTPKEEFSPIIPLATTLGTAIFRKSNNTNENQAENTEQDTNLIEENENQETPENNYIEPIVLNNKENTGEDNSFVSDDNFYIEKNELPPSLDEFKEINPLEMDNNENHYSSETEAEKTERVEEQETVNEVVEEDNDDKKKPGCLTPLILLLLAGLLLFGIYHFRDNIIKYINEKTPMNISFKSNIKVDEPKIEETTIVSDTIDSLKQEVQDEDLIKIKKEIVPQKTQKVNSLAPIGKETLKNGQTLRQISLKYYGNKSFWVYIYQENKNKINNPNNVPIGTKLVIPSPHKYDINVKNSNSLKKAKDFEADIFNALGSNPSCK